ncbi:MAG: polyprenyl synthetase family protein [Planctomycetota bacterium]
MSSEHAPCRRDLERVAALALTEAGASHAYLGWMMVVLASEFWRPHVAATPPERRLMLAPPCLFRAGPCKRAEADQINDDGQCQCGNVCQLPAWREKAERLGYRVMVAENASGIMKAVVSGECDAVVGVACLGILEQATHSLVAAGVPCMAAPLLECACQDSSIDESWARELIDLPYQPSHQPKPLGFIEELRASRQMFAEAELNPLLPSRATSPPPGPLGATSRIACDFLARGGKYARPFITLAAYSACLERPHAEAADARQPDHAKRVALSIETFHKASLVHDDIQDDDAFRYGVPTVHREHGVATAINVGDYLIGLGYEIVAEDAASMGAAAAADILRKLAECHTRLAEGQGAELLWRDGSGETFTPADALEVYARKTSPAFEAALYGGVRLAREAEDVEQLIHEFCKRLGVAFQILNDLKDWRGDSDNKLEAGGDVLGNRPTLLLALAMERLDDAGRGELRSLLDACPADAVQRVRKLYEGAGVFEAAMATIGDNQAQAETLAEKMPTPRLRRLAFYLIDAVLAGPNDPSAQAKASQATAAP